MPGNELFGQIALRATRSRNPQNFFHEHPRIAAGLARIA